MQPSIWAAMLQPIVELAILSPSLWTSLCSKGTQEFIEGTTAAGNNLLCSRPSVLRVAVLCSVTPLQCIYIARSSLAQSHLELRRFSSNSSCQRGVRQSQKRMNQPSSNHGPPLRHSAFSRG